MMKRLSEHWRVWKTTPAQYDSPVWIQSASDSPMPATAPNTVASLLRDSTPQPIENLSDSDLDSFDWWYALDFEKPEAGVKHFLRFDGLATIADIWLNGELLLHTDNMFRAYRVDVTNSLQPKNELVICFRSLKEHLELSRKRPKWKTRLVDNQNLRWVRTTLLGSIPGWTPPVKPIGIWREAWLESADAVCLNDFSLHTSFQNETGILRLKADVSNLTEQPCEIFFEINGEMHSLFAGSALIIQIDNELHVPNIHAWMPHTHGTPNLYQTRLLFKSGDQLQVLNEARVGFRHIHLNRNDGLFQFQVNGQNIFARGAVWMVNDVFSLSGDPKTALTLARAAGMNMLRVGGTMIYEQDSFYDLCDDLGIMVWQDFMFANMDYPVKDEAFHENIFIEAAQQLKRLSKHACVVAYCGNSEVEQQASMLGIPAGMWRNEWFADELPALVKAYNPEAAYVPSSPSEGLFPFYTSEGPTHYYGVGAYRRGISDVRRADVKFASECLGISNVPDDQTIIKLMGDLVFADEQKWKSRAPRDSGSDYDFEDVRDHYFAELFGLNPNEVRKENLEHYLALSRIVSGEMMSRVFSEWRSSCSHCGGGLVWFYKDLLPGAGWGVIDSDNNPKAAYYFLKRVFQSIQVLITDEGLQGLRLHLVNETLQVFSGKLEFSMLMDGHVFVAKTVHDVTVAANQTVTFQAEELLGGFYDTAYAYRFGPPKHDLSCATLKDEQGKIISQQFHFPLKQIPPLVPANLERTLVALGNGGYQVDICSDHFLYAVSVSAEGYLPSDNYFHLMPGESKSVTLLPISSHASKPDIKLRCMNAKGIDLA
ncbi:MAG: glycoside hydrolase family 2 protein [Chloroflexi bacterium]|nr:glycoside hydrolase family 2 protein [Chloroflexota bacterium]